MNDRVSISGTTFNKIINILGQLPYQQVAAIMVEVHNDVKPLVPRADATDNEEASE